ncbi:erg26, C-3 sterol dehydrogenase [Xylographa pallens]|nr:erg26, C-3 sterol dehydrogenase [Xylographa pallens]
MSTVNVLITGGNGFVGSAIVDALQEKHPDWALTVFDVKLPSDEKSKVQYLAGDVTMMADVRRAMQTAKPKIVIHTAGLVPQLESRYDRRIKERVFGVNVEGTRKMLAAANAFGAEAFVWTSSCCCVTDDMRYEYRNIDETYPTSSQSLVYGESKAIAEALVLAASDEKLATCAIRPSVLLGPGDYVLIPSIYACIAKLETPFVIGDGLNMWDVTYVGNVADAHVLAAENLISSKTAAGEAFFVSNNEPIAFRDICLAVWAQFGHYPPFEMRVPAGLAVFTGYVWEWVTWLTGAPLTLSSGSVRDACGIRYINGKKAECILGYTPRVGIEEAIETSCKAYAAKLKGDAIEKTLHANGHAMNGSA